MRSVASLALLLLLAACIPRTTPPPGYGAGRARPAGRGMATVPPVPQDPAAYRMCLADLATLGAEVTPLPDRVYPNGCSAVSAVKFVAIGIPVTSLGAVTCGMARPFTEWVRQTVQSAAADRLGSRVVRIESFGSFACRPINNQEGNRLSEHGRANAIDVAAFVLADGRRVTVRDGWNGPDEAASAFLHQLHAAACRRFNIVMRPDANAFHHDHFHFDMGNGRYCR